ncbi:hypothetical protein KLEP181_gp58 [Paracoccus phage vB_PmaP_KLEP18-1]|nr:hypothetical protein KLEP181_gp58 [Paracoccus phage vB_PmaP_KLEP18-1]
MAPRPAPTVLHIGRSTIQGDDLVAAWKSTGRMVAVTETEKAK